MPFLTLPGTFNGKNVRLSHVNVHHTRGHTWLKIKKPAASQKWRRIHAPKVRQARDPPAPEWFQDGGGRVITEKVLAMLVQREDDPVQETQNLLAAELHYNRERLEIIRVHNEKDPNEIENRETKRFRRKQYQLLSAILIPLLAALPFINIGPATIYGAIALMIVAGVLLNGRDRTMDLESMTQILQTILKMSSLRYFLFLPLVNTGLITLFFWLASVNKWNLASRRLIDLDFAKEQDLFLFLAFLATMGLCLAFNWFFLSSAFSRDERMARKIFQS